MPKKVYSNVEDHRLLDGTRVIEDVTSVVLPTIEHPTVTIDAAGMAGAVDFPNEVKVNAMELAINHNNGVNTASLQNPGKHNIEFRVVRMNYNVQKGDSGHESVKYRFAVRHKSNEKGTVEAGNPWGSTDRFSVLRYEEIVNGKTTVLIDLMAGTIQFNDRNYTDPVQNMLN